MNSASKVQNPERIYQNDAVSLYDTCPAPNYQNIVNFIRMSCSKIGSSFDVGCGTGSLVKILRSEGWDSHGCDTSEPMVKAAREKNPSARIEIQSATDFEVNSKVNLITCTFDVLNHLENKKKISTFFKRSFSKLQHGGILIFDSLAPDDINNNWNGYVEVDSWEDLFLIRRGKKISFGKGVLTYDFFKKIEKNHWSKSTEIHTLIAPSRSWIEHTLLSLGFNKVRALDATFLKKPNKKTVRYVFSAQKPKNKPDTN
jgi:2-polyprenyl-3-methyl-5-hydroxy-6-metoxy-1,4-benzoquinol methylase